MEKEQNFDNVQWDIAGHTSCRSSSALSYSRDHPPMRQMSVFFFQFCNIPIWQFEHRLSELLRKPAIVHLFNTSVVEWRINCAFSYISFFTINLSCACSIENTRSLIGIQDCKKQSKIVIITTIMCLFHNLPPQSITYYKSEKCPSH